MKLLTQLVKKLDKIIELLTAEKEARDEQSREAARIEKEQMLVEYARRHNKQLPSPMARTTREIDMLPVDGARDAIPYGLSNAEQATLKMWYDESDNRVK
jgi:hypothetical protein